MEKPAKKASDIYKPGYLYVSLFSPDLKQLKILYSPRTMKSKLLFSLNFSPNFYSKVFLVGMIIMDLKLTSTLLKYGLNRDFTYICIYVDEHT